MIVNLDVDVYTKSRINQKTLQKTKKSNRNRLRRGPVFTFTVREAVHPSVSYIITSELVYCTVQQFHLSLDVIIIFQ